MLRGRSCNILMLCTGSLAHVMYDLLRSPCKLALCEAQAAAELSFVLGHAPALDLLEAITELLIFIYCSRPCCVHSDMHKKWGCWQFGGTAVSLAEKSRLRHQLGLRRRTKHSSVAEALSACAEDLSVDQDQAGQSLSASMYCNSSTFSNRL